MGRRKKDDSEGLPMGVTRKRGRLYVTFKGLDGKRHMRAAGLTQDDMRATMKVLGLKPRPAAAYVMPKDHPVYLWRRARINARTKGLLFTITRQEVADMIERAEGRCPIAGVRFEYIKEEGKRFRPWAPSLDRIVPQLGYVPGNCRIICAYVNLAMNEFGEEIFAAIAWYVGRRRPKKIADTRPQSVTESGLAPFLTLVPAPVVDG